MKKGDKVIISDEAVHDQKIPSNEGELVLEFTEPCIGGLDYELVEVKVEGVIHVVGKHEIKIKGN